MALAVAPGQDDPEMQNERWLSDEQLKQWGFKEVLTGESVIIEARELIDLGVCRGVGLCTKTGVNIGFLQQNPLNNHGDCSYTFWNPEGERVILPASLCSVTPLAYDIGRESLLGVQHDDVAGKHIRLHLSGHAFSIEDLGGENGTIYRFADLDENFVDHLCKIPTGRDGLLEGQIGGRRMVMYSAREIGRLYVNKYVFLNEDSGGFNEEMGRVVIADGIGGGPYGELASSMVVSRIKDAWCESLEDAVKGVADDWYKLNAMLPIDLKVDLGKQRSNAVFGAIQLRGNNLEIVTGGDTIVTVFRGGKELYSSPRRTLKYQKVIDDAEKMSEADYYRNPEFFADDYLLYSLSSIRTGHYDKHTVALQKGDIVLARTDGMDIRSNRQLGRMIGGMTNPEKIVNFVVQDTAGVNRMGSYSRDCLDQHGRVETIRNLPYPGDNGTVFALVY